jgi:hypothetical protein
MKEFLGKVGRSNGLRPLPEMEVGKISVKWQFER